MYTYINSGKLTFLRKGMNRLQVMEHSLTMQWLLLRPWLRALRCHQWAKNTLIFVPMLVSHRLNEWSTVQASLIAFISFSLLCSSGYLINDIQDRKRDQQHPRKRSRPFACNQLSKQSGLIASAILLLSSYSLGFLLTTELIITNCAYFIIAISYSFYLKRLLLIDVMALAILYTLRIIAGCAATGIHISQWLFIFSLFTFFGFALLKRCGELKLLANNDFNNGRAYQLLDLPLLQQIGICSSLIGILVLGIYTSSPASEEFYTQPHWLWAICILLLFWSCRLWLLMAREILTDDPILFALRDKISYGVLVLIMICFYLAT